MFHRWVNILSVLAYLAVQSQATGASVWDGGGSDNNWSSALNWADNITPTNNGTADVTISGSTRLTPTVDVPWDINSLTFSSGSKFTLGGSALTIGSGGIINQSSTIQKLNNSVVLSADQI
jgi:hypothetical protein